MIKTLHSRSEWLDARQKYITASEVAAILGWDERRTALDIYVAKKTGSHIGDNDAMLIGRCLEGGAASVYAEKTGRPIYDPNPCLAVHAELPWLAATPDRLTWATEEDSQSVGGSPLEIKNAGWVKRRDWEDGAPLWVQIQLQIQMACLGAIWGAYCGIVGGCEIHLGDVDFSEEFFGDAVERLEEFKWRLDNNKAPPVDSPKHLRAMKLLHPNDNGETVDLSQEILGLANQLEAEKEVIKSSSESKDEIEARIREAIGSATFGRLPDGTVMSLKTTARKGFTSVVKPTTFRTLRRSK